MLGKNTLNDLRIKLLRKQREKGLTGFTPAYLVGACRTPIGEENSNEGQDYQEFVELLEFLQKLDTEQKSRIGISECIKLKQPVVALYNSSKEIEDYALDAIDSNNKNSTLYASSQYHKKGSFDSLIEILWKQSEQHILVGDFSFNNGTYSKFSEEDINFIQSVNNA